MKKDIRNIYWTILIVWAVIASVCAIVFALTYNKNLPMDSPETINALRFYNIGYITCLLFAVLSVFFILGFFVTSLVKGFIDNPKKALSSLVSIFGIGLVALVSYILASPTDISAEILEKTNTSESLSKWIGTGVITIYFLTAGVFISALYAEVAKKFK